MNTAVTVMGVRFSESKRDQKGRIPHMGKHAQNKDSAQKIGNGRTAIQMCPREIYYASMDPKKNEKGGARSANGVEKCTQGFSAET